MDDGRIETRFHAPGPKISRQQIGKGSDAHQEMRDEFEVTETWSGEIVREWAEALGREGERGRADGEVTGEFPRQSRLRSALDAAGMSPEELGQRAYISVERVLQLLNSGDVPGTDVRLAIEAVCPDAYPEVADAIAPSPNQLSGDSEDQREHRSGAPGPTAADEEKKTVARAALLADIRRDKERREAVQAAFERKRARELDTGLSDIAKRFRRVAERLK